MWRIEETEQFATQVAKLTKEFPRLSAALDGIRWALQRDPTEAELVGLNMKPGIHAYALKLDAWPQVPKAIVYFTLEPDLVRLYAIYRSDSPGGPAF